MSENVFVDQTTSICQIGFQIKVFQQHYNSTSLQQQNMLNYLKSQWNKYHHQYHHQQLHYQPKNTHVTL